MKRAVKSAKPKRRGKPPIKSPDSASTVDHDVDPLRERLSPFFGLNPEAEYQSGSEGARIIKPWGDPTIQISLAIENTELLEALNRVRLPPRFSALWHNDSHELEFIYTTLPIDHDLRSRKFDFTFGGRTYPCEFGDSSARLLAIAKAHQPILAPSVSRHRNLGSYWIHWHYVEEHPEKPPPEAATSFWVRDVEWRDDEVAEMVRHLNFYLTFHDRQSPWINIIDEPLEPPVPPVRYPYDEFPAAIVARQLDPYLLSVWQSMTDSPDPFRRFIYAYQVLEFRAFSAVQDGTLQAIKRLLATPGTAGRFDEAARELVEIVAADKLQDEAARLVQVCKQFVNPDHLWKQIEPNATYFSQEIHFDGGLTIEPLLKSGASKQAFVQNWLNQFPPAIRRIRNALVHGREQRVVVAPTPSNHARLRPWLAPLTLAAQEALLFGASQ